MIKKKGFTMIELLAVVVILGIIGTIGVAGVTRIIKSSYERHNLAQAKLFISGAQMYFTDNKSKLPTKTFTSKMVTLQELQEQNYVEKIVDYKKEEYDANKSYAYVTKMGTGKYAYDGELITQNGERTKYNPEQNNNGSIEFYWQNKKFRNTQTEYTNANKKEETVINVKIQDSDMIAGYIITLYKSEKELRQLEYKEIGNKKELETKITIRPEEYPNGQYQIQVKVIDIYNNQKTAISGTLVLDTIAPKCTVQINDGKLGENNWYTSDVTVKLKCFDYDENRNMNKSSGCVPVDSTTHPLLVPKLKTSGAVGIRGYEKIKENEYTIKSGKAEGTSILTYKVFDKAKNSATCKKELRIDSVPPEVNLEIFSNDDKFNTFKADIRVQGKDINPVKYTISDKEPEKELPKYKDMSSLGQPNSNIISYKQDDWVMSYGGYDGTTKTIYVVAKDEAGNKRIKQKSYTIYKQCTNKITDDKPYNIGSCSVLCGPGGLQAAYYRQYDSYLSSNSHPVQCEDVNLPQPCNGQSCCSAVTFKKRECKANAGGCGNGTQKVQAYSKYNNERCSDKDKKSSCIKTACDTAGTSEKCFVGNTKYCVPYTIQNGDCKGEKSGYWFYCMTSAGLKTALGRSYKEKNPEYVLADHAQWACPKKGNTPVAGKTITLMSGGKNYTYKVIDDSGSIWKELSPPASFYEGTQNAYSNTKPCS